MKQRFITIGEAADRAGCSRQAIHAAIRAKRIVAEPTAVTRYVWKVDVASLNEFKPNPKMRRNGRPAKK